MSAFKGTPGPWLADGRTIYALTHYGWRKGVKQLANRFSAHVVLGHEFDSEEAEANARLIAAAPELLEVAQRSADALRSAGIEPRATSDNPLEWLLHQTEAAIAKATGGDA